MNRDAELREIHSKVDDLAGRVDGLEPKKIVLTIEDMEKELGIDRNTALRWFGAGLIPGFKIGKYWYSPVKSWEILGEKLAQEYIEDHLPQRALR
jgi:hypothetical protein